MDSNAVDPLADMPGAYEAAREAVEAGHLEILLTHVTIDELDLARSGLCWRSRRGSFRACSGSWLPWDPASRMTHGERMPWPARIAGWSST